MANIDTLKTALEAEIEHIDDDLAKAEAAVLCDRYIAALTGQSDMEAGAVQSYSIAGRTVTRRNAGEGQRLIESLRSQLYAYLRGPGALVSMGGYA